MLHHRARDGGRGGSTTTLKPAPESLDETAVFISKCIVDSEPRRILETPDPEYLHTRVAESEILFAMKRSEGTAAVNEYLNREQSERPSELFLPSNIFRIADQELSMSEAQTFATKDHPVIQVAQEVTLGPFEKGREYRMERWLAERLRNEGVLDIKDPQPVTNTEVSKILWREVRSSVATKLPERFYAKFRGYLQHLKQGAGKTGRSTIVREEEQARQNLRDLVNSRLQKILRLTLAINPPPSALEGLTQEERELYQQVREILDSWTQELHEI